MHADTRAENADAGTQAWSNALAGVARPKACGVENCCQPAQCVSRHRHLLFRTINAYNRQ
eukprot:10994034-Lingulodinium_polyedra.AAC.1